MIIRKLIVAILITLIFDFISLLIVRIAVDDWKSYLKNEIAVLIIIIIGSVVIFSAPFIFI